METRWWGRGKPATQPQAAGTSRIYSLVLYLSRKAQTGTTATIYLGLTMSDLARLAVTRDHCPSDCRAPFNNQPVVIPSSLIPMFAMLALNKYIPQTQS